MTEQETIQGLKNLFSEHELDLPCMDSLEILHMAIKALENQAGIERALKRLEKLAEKHAAIITIYDEYNAGKLEAYTHAIEIIKEEVG